MNFRYSAINKAGKTRERPHRGRRGVHRQNRNQEQGTLSGFPKGSDRGRREGKQEVLLFLRRETEAARAVGAAARLPFERRGTTLPSPYDNSEPAGGGEGESHSGVSPRRSERGLLAFGRPQGLPRDLRQPLRLLRGSGGEERGTRLDPAIPGRSPRKPRGRQRQNKGGHDISYYHDHGRNGRSPVSRRLRRAHGDEGL